MLAKAVETALGKSDGDDRNFRVFELIETVAKENRLRRTAESVEGGARRQRFAIAVILAPADFEILKAVEVMAGGPDPGWNLQALHRDARVKDAVIDDEDGASRLAGAWRKERFVRPDTAEGEERTARGEDELYDRKCDALRGT